jgi:serine protease Do
MTMKTLRFPGAIIGLLLVLLAAPPAMAQLPDFVPLVERVSPAVVNITARKTAGSGDDPSEMAPEDMPELFRRFFGPGMPGMPSPHGGMPERVSGGSGFIISPDGYILTNHHVIDDANEVTVRLDDRREFVAKVVGSDPLSDVALLKVEGTGLPSVELGDSESLKPGQWVLAIGSPFGLEQTVSAGIVSAIGRSMPGQDQRYVPFIQTDVAINRGNSGGPLFDMSGAVVGINSQIFSNTGGSIGLSFAIPIEVAKSVSDQLRSKGRVSRGVIGVQIQEITRDLAESLGLERAGGALVGQVQPGSAAEKAGIKLGDVITAFNGRAIVDSSDLPPLVGATAPGTRVTVDLVRDGKPLKLPVTVAELEAGATAQAAPTEEARKTANRLGIAVRDLGNDERETLGLDREGVLVERVTGAAARRAGLQTGDVILMVGRTRIASVSQFEQAAAAIQAGQAVMLLVRRGDATSFIAIRPTETQ